MTEIVYIKSEDRLAGKTYHQFAQGFVQYTDQEQAIYDAKLLAHELLLPSLQIKAEILRLEAQITDRRRDEAILQTDAGWLLNQRILIAIERAKL